MMGLIYLAVSRAMNLTGLTFEEPFDFTRSHNPLSKTELMRIRDKARQLPGSYLCLLFQCKSKVNRWQWRWEYPQLHV